MLDFVSTRSHLEAVAFFSHRTVSHKLISLRLNRMRQHYPWLSGGLDYFTGRLTQAPEDAELHLRWVVKHAPNAPGAKTLRMAALRAKCDILWAQLDALYLLMLIQAGRPRRLSSPQKES